MAEVTNSQVVITLSRAANPLFVFPVFIFRRKSDMIGTKRRPPSLLLCWLRTCKKKTYKLNTKINM